MHHRWPPSHSRDERPHWSRRGHLRILGHCRTGQHRTPSSWHPTMGFRCSLPGRPRWTHPWVKPRIGRHHIPSSRHPQYDFLVQQIGPSFTLPLPQQLPSSTLVGCLSSTAPAPPTPVTDWVVDFDATNHTTPHYGHISPRPPSLAHPPSLLVMVMSCLSPQYATRCFPDNFTSMMCW
jgi:hypothetical protein